MLINIHIFPVEKDELQKEKGSHVGSAARGESSLVGDEEAGLRGREVERVWRQVGAGRNCGGGRSQGVGRRVWPRRQHHGPR